MSAKQDSEKLTKSVLYVADVLLKKFGEFLPYGGYMELNGRNVIVGVKDLKTDHPKPQDLLDALRTSFQQQARAKRCRAIAIVVDVTLHSSGSDRKRDAIQVSVEHRDGYAVNVFFPYQIVNKKVIYGDKFIQPRKREIVL
jgi:hypothetical protein